MATLTLLNLPIGNLEDLTERVRKVLESGNHFVVEDTRSFKALLSALGIGLEGRAIYSFHDQSSGKKVEELVGLMNKGISLNMASEAGSPIISDPAFPLVKLALEKGHEVKTLSGISSPIYALELSGLPPLPMHFHGFLPREEGKRREFFEEHSVMGGTHIFFESPHRIESTMEIASDLIPDMDFVICRELSKKFESVYRFKAGEWDDVSKRFEFRGEMVGLFYIPRNDSDNGKVASVKLREMAFQILEKGNKPKLVSKLIAEILGEKPGDVYSRLNKSL